MAAPVPIPTSNQVFGIPPPPPFFIPHPAVVLPTCMLVRSLEDDDLGVIYMMCPWDTFPLVYNDYTSRLVCSPQHILICREGGEVVPPLRTPGEIGLLEGETLIVLSWVSGLHVHLTPYLLFDIFVKLFNCH